MRATHAVPVGLFAAWCVNDAEELLTMAPTSRRVLERLPAAVPIPPAWRTRGLPQKHVNVGIGVMAAVMAGFAYEGWRSGGRSPWFQDAMTVFGLHGITHMLSPLVVGGYATGAATGPVCTAYWLWGRRALAREGVEVRFRPASALLFPVAMALSHGAGYLATRSARSTSRSAASPCSGTGQ